jgi:hypothetical protein
MTYSLDLMFLKSKQHNPIAKVHLKTYTQGGYKGINPDLIFITPECMTPRELDEQIDRLHAELERLRKRGRSAFAKALASN